MLAFGDFSVIAWVITVLYFVAAWLCLRASRAGTDVGLWRAFFVLMTALGVNKQGDFQTWVTVVGRHVANRMGWYQHKYVLQGYFVLVVVAAAVMLLALLVWCVGRRWLRVWPALTGVAFLCAFIVLRASSFHHVDYWLGRRILPFASLHAGMELCALLLVVWGAWRAGGGRSAGAVAQDRAPGRDATGLQRRR